MTSSHLLSAGNGLVFGLSLIVAIGAQGLFVLREGLRRTHVLPVVMIAALSDVVLIAAGTAGLGALIDDRPWLLLWARLGGAAFLVLYGVKAGLGALRPRTVAGSEPDRPSSRQAAVVGAFLLTWLNPHVYLDTVVLLGSISATYGDLRWWFGGGAMVASALWFASLGYGARLLAPVFARPAAWRWLDGAVAVTMLVIAVGLVLGR